MKIVADSNMPALEETFGRHGRLVRLPGRSISRSDLSDAKVLLVRSVTQVNADLLQGTNVAFVGSATIGMDHLDTDWLEENDIAWAHAPGCNADAASQYTLAMMWLACERLGRDFRQQRIAIIGRGNVGRRLEHLLKTLDIPVVACDPPLQDDLQQEQDKLQLVSMAEACANGIISLHVPLTHTGKYPTGNLFDPARLAALQPGTLLVNTSRGGVIDKTALLAQLRSGRLHAALDVWPDEPFITPDLLKAVTVATPHVAGYSLEGKRAGTEMIYQAFCRAFAHQAVVPTRTMTDIMAPVFPPSAAPHEIVQQLVDASCPVSRDDADLRALSRLPHSQGRIQFDVLRAAYPVRREFKSHRVTGTTATQTNLLTRLGFKTM